MDEKANRRPWFQFYLSTAIVLMFTASVLLWLEICPHAVRDDDLHIIDGVEGRGAPLTFQWWRYHTKDAAFDWDIEALLIDLLFDFAVIAGVAYLVRGYNQRREAESPIFDDTWTARERRQYDQDSG
jgi:hypothetical protein